MKRSKFLSVVALLGAVSLVAAACGDEGGGGGGGGGGGDAAADCTWTIGTMGALSGDYAAIGDPIHQGIEYGVNQVNENGDLPCDLELQSEDSQGNPEQAPQLAQSLVENEELVGIVGPYFSGETLAVGDIFNDSGVAFLCPSCTNETIDDQGWDTFFRAVADDEVQGEQGGVYIESLNPTSVAIVHDNQDYSKGLAERVADQLGDLATQPIVISPEETDYSAAVAEVENSGADVVFYGGYVPQAGPLAKQLAEGGVDAQFISDDGTKDNQFGELAGKAAEGAQVTCPCADPNEVEGGAEFVSGMEEEYGEAPGTFAAEGYDSVNLIAEALMDADPEASIEEVRQTVVDYLDQVEGYAGIVKEYTFNDQGNVEVGPEGIYVYEWDPKEETFVIVGSVQELAGGQ